MMWFFFFFTPYWKDIRGYEGNYQISDSGQVRSLDKIIKCVNGRAYFRKGRVLRPFQGATSKYLEIQLCVDNKSKKFLIHRLVASHFIKNNDSKMEVNHKDGNIFNNNVSNLEYVTHVDNIRHAINTGLTKQKGEYSVRAKITNKQANCMRCMHFNFKIKQKIIADIFGVNKQLVNSVVNFKSYK